MNLLIGCSTMVICLALQCFVVGILLRVLFLLETKNLIRPTVVGASSLLVVVMLIMLAGNFVQITLWAWLFFICGEFKEFATAFYHSVVNFATLGYGDIVMSEKRRLLGALEAANGVLMFGLTTGVIFSVISEIAEREWGMLGSQNAVSDRPQQESGEQQPQ